MRLPPHTADIPRRAFQLAAATLLALATALPAAAQGNRAAELFDRIRWADGPIAGELGDVAEVAVPASCRFTDAEGAKLFLEATENPPSGNELGILLCQSARVDAGPWFVVFSFDESGYVKDDDKNELDADAILASLKRDNNAGNKERRQRGWETITLNGWERAPHYDPRTHNLTWSTRLTSEGATEETINHSVRLLGRRGVMQADLVISKADLATAVPSFDRMIAAYSYLPGHRYAEWRAGDKVAPYGLAALIAGGAAAKMGLFGKLWKVIVGLLLAMKKLVIVLVVGALALAKRLFGRREDPEDASSEPYTPVRAPSGAYRPARPTPSSSVASDA